MFYLPDGLLQPGGSVRPYDVASSQEMALGSKSGHLFLSYCSQRQS